MSKPVILNWYALIVPPGKEYVAALLLERRWGCRTYVPTETRWRRRNRYCKSKEEFAFAVAPRYVLAGFSGLPRWFDVLTSPAITDVIRLNDNPKRLDRTTAIFDRAGNCRRLTDEFLARYMAGTSNGRLDVAEGRVVTDARAAQAERWMRTHKEFKAGDEVEIVSGPFRDRRVTVLEINGHMARLDLELFGGADGGGVSVEVPVMDLEAA